jgi:hypothetical protein
MDYITQGGQGSVYHLSLVVYLAMLAHLPLNAILNSFYNCKVSFCKNEVIGNIVM